MDYHNDPSVTQFLDLMFSHNFFPAINIPTRIGSTSNTILDCIFTNSLSPALSGAILEFGISDHLPVFLFSDVPDKNKTNKVECSIRRDLKTENVARFNEWLTNELVDYTSIDSPEAALRMLQTKIEEQINNFLPIQRKNRKTTALKPWITRGILNSINTKNNLYKGYLRNKTLDNLQRFKGYKNGLVTIMRAAKKKYFQDLIEKNKDDSGKLWKILKEVTGRNSGHTTRIENILVDDVSYPDPQGISNGLNNFFTSIGKKLDQSIPQSQIDPTSYIHADIPNTCFFNPVNSEDIKSVLKDLKNKGNGIEPFSNKILKLLCPSISAPLSHLVNLCFLNGIFPDDLKIATVTPIFKAGDKTNPGNYRPISVISTISKIIEKCIYKRLMAFINNLNILSETQFGFRTKHSTEHALLNFVDFATSELEQGNNVLGIYLDIKKAFDSVNYIILFKKLDKYGIRGKPLELIKSYLSNRCQRVKLIDPNGNKILSDEKAINCGVPQGSVLGPLLFLLYVNDLKNASDVFRVITFADDTNLCLAHHNIDYLCNLANDEVSKVISWFVPAIDYV